MDFITADRHLIEASLARVDQFTKDRHIGIIHSTATRHNLPTAQIKNFIVGHSGHRTPISACVKARSGEKIKNLYSDEHNLANFSP